MNCQILWNGRHTVWKITVKANVAVGGMSGRAAKDVSPTRPRVTLLIAASLTLRPSLGATKRINAYSIDRIVRILTIDQDSIRERVHRPYVRCPVRMAKPAGEGE